MLGDGRPMFNPHVVENIPGNLGNHGLEVCIDWLVLRFLSLDILTETLVGIGDQIVHNGNSQLADHERRERVDIESHLDSRHPFIRNNQIHFRRYVKSFVFCFYV